LMINSGSSSKSSRSFMSNTFIRCHASPDICQVHPRHPE
jgi:hypothetical protein